MDFAKLTPAQFVALHLLFAGPKRPRDMHKALRDLGVTLTQGAFSRLVRRLESVQCLDVDYDNPDRDRRLRACRLAATDVGVMAWNATRDFFAAFPPPPPQFVPVPTDEGRLAHLPARVRNSILAKRTKKEFREVMERLASAWFPARRRQRP